MAEIGADGIDGDTQDGVPLAFSLAADKIGHPLAFEPEGGPSDEALAWNILTWGQYQYPFVPMVDKYKWLEPRHMVNISDRWKKDKTDNLQFAFFNGVGWETWESIWGIWNGITPRDAEATRRVATIERGVAPFLVSADWEPFSPMLHYGVFASRWPLNGQTVFTIVNRNEYDVSGPQMALEAQDGMRYFDLYHGSRTQGRAMHTRSGQVILSFDLEAQGYGAILVSRSAPDSGIQSLMANLQKMTAQPLHSFSHGQACCTAATHRREIQSTKPTSSAPENMVNVPEGDFVFQVQGIEIEGFNDNGVDVQYPWEGSPRRFHERPMHMKSFSGSTSIPSRIPSSRHLSRPPSIILRTT